MKRLLLALAVVAIAAGPARALVTVGKTATGPAVQGGTVTYRISITRAPADTNVIVRDPLPAGHDLLSVRTTSGPVVDCTTTTGGSLGSGLTATCASGPTRDLIVAAADFPLAGTTFELFVSYRIRPGQATSTNDAQVTCGAANTPCGNSTASATVGVATARLTKAFSSPSATPGSDVEITLTLTVEAPSDVAGFVVRDVLPAGLTPRQVVPPVPSTIALGPTVTVTPTGPLAPGTYVFILRTTVDAAVAAGTTLRNIAEAVPPGGAPVASNEAQLQITAQPTGATLGKTASRARVKLGESVEWTLTASSGPQPEPGPITLRDALDPALRLDGVRLDGRDVACAELPTAIGVGAATLRCEGAAGSGGRVVVLELPSGDTLAAPLQLRLATTVLPGAPSQITNSATFTGSTGATLTRSATVAVDGATPGGPSLSLTAGKLLAEKGDLVPFHATIAVPRDAPALDAARLSIRATPGLRATDVRLRLPDGSTRIERLVEENGALQVAVGPVPAGATAVVELRARLLGRAQPGVKESLAAQLWERGARMAGASAEVRVLADAEFDLATIVGTVYRDENKNGVRDRGEPGIGGALVVLDDGLQVTTDARGQYHLTGIMPAGGVSGARAFGDRAIKLARHTLPPGARLTTDETRVVPLSPGALVQIDFGVDVPAPEAPLRRPLAPGASMPAGPAIRVDGSDLYYALTGVAAPGARVLACPTIPTVPACAEATVDRKSGAWRVEVPLAHGRTRVGVVTAWPDGRVTVGARDIFQLARAEGGTLIVPRDEEPRAVLRFPAAPLAEPTFLLEGRLLGGATSPALAALEIAGQRVSPDAAGRIQVRLRLPGEGAAIPVTVRFADGVSARFDQRQEARGDFVLLVGLAEGKVGYVLRDGPATGASGLFAQGRVKLYAKGRIQGRWLLEGGLDLDSTAIESWRDLFRGDPQRIFRNLDPDRFYTVYGDASQTTAAAQSRARLFVKLEIEGAQLLFGNFQTGLTGVEMGRYSRAVTGGRISYVRASTDPPGPDGKPRPPTTQVILFGAWLQTAQAHDELRGTGGSLYYLSHKNIVEGSEQVRIELRDQVSNRPQTNAAQRATVDYEIDYLAGRVLLREPLQTVSPTSTLVRSGILDGDRPTLIVDYEYIVEGDIDEGTLGARATQKLGPVRIGATIVNELRTGSGYTLLGGDVSVDLKKYGAIVAEYARSYGALTSFARSDDGGLRWVSGAGPSQAAARDRQGNAWKVEADLQFLGDRVKLRPYARGIDQGYTDTAHAQEAGFVQWGADVEARVWKLSLRAHYDERRFDQAQYDAAGALLTDAAGQPLARRLTRRDIGGDLGGSFGRVTVRLGVRSERLTGDDTNADAALTGARTTIGARIDVRVIPKLTLYALGQYAVEKSGDGLFGRDNSLGALGLVAQLPWALSLQAEGSGGVAGFGGLLGLRSEPVRGRVLYGTVTLSQDRDDRLNATVAAGGRERLLDKNGNMRATLFAEDQFRDGPVELGGRQHVVATGVDLPIWKKLVLGATFERGTVAPSGTPLAGAPPIERTAGTAYASWAGERVRAQIRAEVRSDTTPAAAPGLPMATPAGDQTALSWLVSGMTTLRPHPDVTIRAKIFFARAADTTTTVGATLARSSEASLGFAWRPSFTDRISLFGRYTFLDEFSPLMQARTGQVDPASGLPIVGREQSHVASIASDGRLFWRFSLGEKVALKYRTEPTSGTSALMILWVNRLAFHITNRWDAVVEYRLLSVPGATITHGAAVEANVILVKHLRLGAGWNFADFGDNEITLGRGSENGFYLKAQGFY